MAETTPKRNLLSFQIPLSQFTCEDLPGDIPNPYYPPAIYRDFALLDTAQNTYGKAVYWKDYCDDCDFGTIEYWEFTAQLLDQIRNSDGVIIGKVHRVTENYYETWGNTVNNQFTKEHDTNCWLPGYYPSAAPSVVPSPQITQSPSPTPTPTPTPTTTPTPRPIALSFIQENDPIFATVGVTAEDDWSLAVVGLGELATGNGTVDFQWSGNWDWDMRPGQTYTFRLTSGGQVATKTVTIQEVNGGGGGPNGRPGNVDRPEGRSGFALDPIEKQWLRNARFSSGGSKPKINAAISWKFYVTPNGYTVRVPARWTPRLAENGKGLVFQRPENIIANPVKGQAENCNSIRIMDPTPQHPTGYVRIYNKFGQPVTSNGSPGSLNTTHIDLNTIGQIRNWPEQH